MLCPKNEQMNGNKSPPLIKQKISIHVGHLYQKTSATDEMF